MPPSPKELLHQAIQDACQTSPKLDGGVLTKWVVVAELQLPNSAAGMAVLSGLADGTDLYSWDRNGLLLDAIISNPAGTPL